MKSSKESTYNSRIEKIVITGLGYKPTVATLNGVSVTIASTATSGNDFILTIKSPDVLIGSEFKFELK